MLKKHLVKWISLNSQASYAITIFPAVVLGVFAMIIDGVSPGMWGQQVAALIGFALLGFLRRSSSCISSFAWIAILLCALSATLLFPAAGGARRWLDLGIFNVNAGMLVLPAMLVLMSTLSCPYPVLLLTAGVLCFQPDISQLAALSLGAMPILWQCRRHVRWLAVSLVLLIMCAVRCLSLPTSLEPVTYCEGILGLAGKVSALMQAGGLLALALIPVRFAGLFFRCKQTSALCLTVYYATTILFSFSGQYPVPFMGFGISAIAGYWLAYLLIP